MSVLTDIRAERDGIVSELDALMNNPEFDPTDKTIVENRAKVEAMDARIQSIVDWESRKANSMKLDSIALRHREDQKEHEKQQLELVPSLGEAWTRSAAYEEYKLLPRGTSGRVSMPFDSLVQTRAPILTDTFAGLIQPTRIAPSVPPTSQTPLLDQIARVTVASGSVEWVTYPAASPLGTVTPEGQAKTEAAITPTLVTVTLDTIASWAQYSRQFGEDAPGLVQFLNAALARGIIDKREALAAAELVGNVSIPTVPNATGTLMEGIRLGVATVQDAGYRPTAVVLNPMDYAALDINVFEATLRGPTVNPNFWGVVPVPAGAVASGTAYVGDFNVGMVELVRAEVQVFTTDSHASTFISNVLTTLVEARTKPVVQRPEAIAKVTGVVGALTGAGSSAGSAGSSTAKKG